MKAYLSRLLGKLRGGLTLLIIIAAAFPVLLIAFYMISGNFQLGHIESEIRKQEEAGLKEKNLELRKKLSLIKEQGIDRPEPVQARAMAQKKLYTSLHFMQTCVDCFHATERAA